MGSASSKAGRAAAGAAQRQYPMRPSPGTRETQQAPQQAIRQEELQPKEAQEAQAMAQSRQGLRGEAPSEGRNEAIDLDGRDPQLANALRQIGPVQPNPTYSPSSNAFSSAQSGREPPGPPRPRDNPALTIMAARKRIEDEVEEDKTRFGKQGFEGRRHVDVKTVKRALMLRDEQGVQPAEIERILGLRKGAVNNLGGVGVLEAA